MRQAASIRVAALREFPMHSIRKERGILSNEGWPGEIAEKEASLETEECAHPPGTLGRLRQLTSQIAVRKKTPNRVLPAPTTATVSYLQFTRGTQATARLLIYLDLRYRHPSRV